MADFVYPSLRVESPNVKYVRDESGRTQLEARYRYDSVRCAHDAASNSLKVSLEVTPSQWPRVG